MIFKAFKAKKKIFCCMLATALTASFCGVLKPASAMFGINSGTFKNGDEEIVLRYRTWVGLGINDIGRDGHTQLTRMIQQGNHRVVDYLLKAGADLSIVPPALEKEGYSNVFEYLCGIDLSSFDEMTRENYHSIFNSIAVQYIFCRIPLSINEQMLEESSTTKQTVWDLYGKVCFRSQCGLI